jgi:urease gamma subunit
MKLTPKELDRLTIFTLAELARRRRARGIKLNYPEAVALICDEVMDDKSDRVARACSTETLMSGARVSLLPSHHGGKLLDFERYQGCMRSGRGGLLAGSRNQSDT